MFRIIYFFFLMFEGFKSSKKSIIDFKNAFHLFEAYPEDIWEQKYPNTDWMLWDGSVVCNTAIYKNTKKSKVRAGTFRQNEKSSGE